MFVVIANALEQFSINDLAWLCCDFQLISFLFFDGVRCPYGFFLDTYTASIFVGYLLLMFIVCLVYLVDFLAGAYVIVFFDQLDFIVDGIISELYSFVAARFEYLVLLSLLFFFIFSNNIFGLFPYTFASTSHFSMTFSTALLFFISLNLSGIYYNGYDLFSLFFPKGTPAGILPLLILIEFISYIARVFSLAIRLFANITAGHILVKIIAGFVLGLLRCLIMLVFGGLLLTMLWGLESFIGILQAYVFVVLLTLYIQDATALH